MTIKDPTPHEVEALRVADAIEKLGCLAIATAVRERVANTGLLDDLDLRAVLASAGLTSEQIGESINRVHAAIAATALAGTGEAW